MHATLVGIFADNQTCEAAMETLIRTGFTPSQTSVSADRPLASHQRTLQHGIHGLTLSAATDDDIHQASDIMSAAGAIDIEQRPEPWRDDGWFSETEGSTTAMAPAFGEPSDASPLPQ